MMDMGTGCELAWVAEEEISHLLDHLRRLM